MILSKHKKILINIPSLFLLLFSMNTALGCSKKMANTFPAETNIVVAASSPNVPILKGLSVNPFLRLDITLPSGSPASVFKKIKYTLNKAAISEIERLDFYLSETAAFSKTQLITSYYPTAETGEIPVQLSVNAGMSFVWVSAVLKTGAAIDQKIEMHCTQLVDDAGRACVINQGVSQYVKYTGFAVRKAGDDGVNTYRIPGIIRTDKGTLLSVYDIRYISSADLPGNIDVGLSRSTDGGKT